MVVSDSFTFGVNRDICEIITHSHLPKDRLKLLLEFVFKAYAPIVVISQSIGNSDYVYTFAQSNSAVDLDKLLRILSKREMGWNFSDDVLFSPKPSRIDPVSLMRAIAAARIPNQTAQL